MKLRWAAATIVVLALSALMPTQMAGQQPAPPAKKSANPLGQNYPNPFNPETTIPFAVGDSASCADTPSRQYRVSLRIYNVLAQQWSVEQSDGQRSLTLTLWRPQRGAGDMLSLGVNTAGKSHAVNTVKVGNQGDVKGSGTVTFAPS